MPGGRKRRWAPPMDFLQSLALQDLAPVPVASPPGAFFVGSAQRRAIEWRSAFLCRFVKICQKLQMANGICFGVVEASRRWK
jgi:hypothetical protein